MKILFPDGAMLDRDQIAQMSVGDLTVANPLMTFLLNGYAAKYQYAAYSPDEAAMFASMIESPKPDPNGVVMLPSLLPGAPTAANIVVTPNSGTHLGGTTIVLALPLPVAATPLVDSFRPDGVVTVGGVACTPITFASGLAIMCVTGAHAAGAVNVVYTDIRGTSTKAGAFTYT